MTTFTRDARPAARTWRNRRSMVNDGERSVPCSRRERCPLCACAPPRDERGDRPGGFGPEEDFARSQAAPGRTPGPRRTSPGSPTGRSRPARCPPRAAAPSCVGLRLGPDLASGPRRPRGSARPRGPRCAARRTSGGPDPGRLPSPRSPRLAADPGSSPSLAADRRDVLVRPDAEGGHQVSGDRRGLRRQRRAGRPADLGPERRQLGRPGRRTRPRSASPGCSGSSSGSRRGRSSPLA